MLVWLLAGCVKDEPAADIGANNTTSESSFLSVSIVSAGTTGTRAADDEYTEGDGTYKDGTEKENAVKSVLFLFFDNNGQPVKGIYDDESSSYISYYLWNYSDEDGKAGNGANPDDANHKETVEKVLNHVIKLRFPRIDNKITKPTQIFTVVNPTSDYLSLTTQSLDELKTIVSDYESFNGSSLSGEGGKFVMTNSVYMDKESNVVCTSAITDKNYKDTEAEAAQSPVVIYVERILARIDLKIDLKKSSNTAFEPRTKQITPAGGDSYHIYYTGVDFPAGVRPAGEDNGVYVHFFGWNMFDTPDKSRLIKSIRTDWDDEGLFGTNNGKALIWNSDNYHRSFWAVNPPEDKFGYKNGAFRKSDSDYDDSQINAWVADSQPMPEPGKYVTAYFQENAAPYESVPEDTETGYVAGAPVTPSKIILAARLEDSNGNPQELAKWAGQVYYTWENLKNYICNAVLDLYYVSSSGTDNNIPTVTYSRIKPEHLAYKKNENSSKVTVVLSDKGEAIEEWFVSTDGKEIQPLPVGKTAEEQIIDKIGNKSVEVWENGYTYYHFTIRHLGEDGSPGYYGVVRNHIYEATVSSISGLGTPVTNPDDIVITDEETGVLAAQVKILSWRMVRQDYELNW